MTVLIAKTALLPDGWHDDVRIEIGDDGRIASVQAGVAGKATHDILLPAPVNLHSHGFQRAMAGLTEARGPGGQDSFWTWRRLIYRFLAVLDPDDIEAITAFAQVEMLEAGFATVCEFHYLHHGPGGALYANLAELSARVAAAADLTGIGLTLLPVLYTHGGCDGRALAGGQLRFGNDVDRYAALLDGAQAALGPRPDAVLGLSAHSLRAVSPDVAAALPQMRAGAPIHMHVAEQKAEAAEVHAAHGARPVELALNAVGVDARWCLIHCTQMTDAETAGLAQSGAVAGLCPVTEASLGDGIFPAADFAARGGRFGVGTDSNIRISLAEELRLLEYGQRLRDRARAVLADAGVSTGRRMYDAALAGGAQAAGRATGAIRVGMWADLLTLNASAVDLIGRRGDAILDAFTFARGDAINEVWSAGRAVVRQGTHVARAAVERRYAMRLARILDRL
ncbi:formimidoylglutamate deiminase [Mesobacterium sp. TK19101]|uniref:Formimidoylglutamate deiminase n=1 Tax=Mesobacterium hydrothermale TaxID=3111907 RepID=A0ABU6HH19_9RHOB|nr:formimidoylglutamate deiminase [Mesobacterium sp. TK19101]MEC3861748.1 formimidoylglutamate deiminase [Mesobacterium sp. TK19101]